MDGTLALQGMGDRAKEWSRSSTAMAVQGMATCHVRSGSLPTHGSFAASDSVPLKKRALGEAARALAARKRHRDCTRASVCRSVGAAVTAAEERPKPIVQTNFKHLNLAARRESVSPERPRSKRQVIQFDKVILKLCRPISRYCPFDAPSDHPAAIPIGSADRCPGVQVRNGGMIVHPCPAGLAIKEHAVVQHHAEPSGQGRYPASVCRSLERSNSRNKTAIPGRIERCPVEVPFGTENNVAELVVDPELAAANESAAV